MVTEAHVCKQLAQSCTLQQNCGRNLNPRPVDCKSLTTRPPSHTILCSYLTYTKACYLHLHAHHKMADHPNLHGKPRCWRWFSRFLRHPARKWSGSILTTPEPARDASTRGVVVDGNTSTYSRPRRWSPCSPPLRHSATPRWCTPATSRSGTGWRRTASAAARLPPTAWRVCRRLPRCSSVRPTCRGSRCRRRIATPAVCTARWRTASGPRHTSLALIYTRDLISSVTELTTNYCHKRTTCCEHFLGFQVFCKGKVKADHAPRESVGGCSSPSSRPWAHRWKTTNVCNMWPVQWQTYGCLPSHKASPPIGWYQFILLGDRGTC